MFYDFTISGAGLSGLLFACMLKKLGFSFYIFDGKGKSTQDNRTSTISKTSAEFLKELGIWHKLQDSAEPILDIYTYEKNSSSFLHFKNEECNAQKQPMGFVVPNIILKATMQQDLQINYGQTYKNFYTSAEKVRLFFDDGKKIDAKFMIAAEGRNSVCANRLNLLKISKYYRQACIICNLKGKTKHANIAKEIFTKCGPIALLPLNNEYEFSLIWTVDFALASKITQLNEKEFLDQVTKICDTQFERILTQRSYYPIKLQMVSKCFYKNIILAGDCIHSIHPVAGQGFNLTIYDIAALYKILQKYGIDALPYMLQSYSVNRLKNNVSMALFTDILVRGFSNNYAPLKVARNIALDVINCTNKLKAFFMNRAMGCGAI